jgi:hypothetical protein
MSNAKTVQYKNVMETLVDKEVARQLQKVPVAMRSYLDAAQISTYALNRLPVLYASSEAGKNKQLERGKNTYQQDIEVAVRRGIAAVERDPLRASDPIVTVSEETELDQAHKALKQVEELLRHRQLLVEHKLKWGNLLQSVTYALNKLSRSILIQQRKNMSSDDFHKYH